MRSLNSNKSVFLVVLALFMVFIAAFGVQAEDEPVKLTVIGDAGHNQKPFEWYKDEILEKFNVKLSIEGVPFASVYEKEKLEFVSHTGAYDIITFYPKLLGDYAKNQHIIPLDEYNEKLSLELDDVAAGFREFYTKFQGKIYAAPYDGDVLMLYYRKDLFHHEDEQQAFMEKFGYELQPPETWKQFEDIAEFFTREKGEKLAGETVSEDFYGAASYGNRDWLWAWWLNRFAAYGGKYFDPETMDPLLDSEAGFQATRDLIQVSEYFPPNYLALGYEELKNVFLNGDTAMVIQWADVGKKAADPEQSQVVGKVGYSHVPGVEKNGEVYWRAAMPCGRVLGVNADSDHPWKAYQVIQYVSVETSLNDVSTPKTGLDPYRLSHLNKPEEYEMFPSNEQAQRYLDAVKTNLQRGYPEPLMPGANQYETSLSAEIQKAIQGKKSPEKAMNDAAKEWENITKRFGLSAQKEIYQKLVESWEEAGLW